MKVGISGHLYGSPTICGVAPLGTERFEAQGSLSDIEHQLAQFLSIPRGSRYGSYSSSKFHCPDFAITLDDDGAVVKTHIWGYMSGDAISSFLAQLEQNIADQIAQIQASCSDDALAILMIHEDSAYFRTYCEEHDLSVEICKTIIRHCFTWRGQVDLLSQAAKVVSRDGTAYHISLRYLLKTAVPS